MKQFLQKKVSEKSLGEKLHVIRKRKHLSLEQAEDETKVRLRYLEALEKGAYSQLPADVYTLGFLVRYAEFLGADKEDLIGSFREERGAAKNQRLMVREVHLKDKKAYITAKTVVGALIILLGLSFAGYIFYAVKNFTSAPNLEIQSPSTETVIKQDRVEVIGKTDEGASLKINDQTVYLDEVGNFRETVKLQPGLNNIELRAINRAKKENVKVVKILAEY